MDNDTKPMTALTRLIALEKTGERNALRHYFDVGALVPQVQQEEGLTHLHQAAEMIAQAMIKADHGVKNQQHYMDAHRAWEGTTAEEKALFLKRCVKPTHCGIYVRCTTKAKQRLIAGLEAGAIVSRIFHAELEAMQGRTGRKNWKDVGSVKPDAEPNPGELIIPVTVRRNFEVQHESIIDGVCSVLTQLDAKERANVLKQIEDRLGRIKP
jgi:hypothetical protein